MRSAQHDRTLVQCFERGLAIAWSQANHVATSEVVFAIATRIPCRIVLRDEIFPWFCAIIAQGAADNLFYLAVVQINAWSEFCHRLPRTNHYDASNSSTK